jgi:hypothetical protein
LLESALVQLALQRQVRELPRDITDQRRRLAGARQGERELEAQRVTAREHEQRSATELASAKHAVSPDAAADAGQAAKQAKWNRIQVTRKLEQARHKRRQIERKLREAEKRAVRNDLILLHFNAWRYQDAGQIWAGLAHHLTTELRGTLSRWDRMTLPLSYARRHHRQLWVGVAIPTIAIVVAVLAVVLGVKAPSKPAGGVLLGTTVLVLLAFLTWRIGKATKPAVDWVAENLRLPDHTSAMGYQHQVIDDLKVIADRVRRRHGQRRLIVFIDDLDRCSREQIMDFLSAIHLVLGDSDFFVILGIDARMIRWALSSRYQSNGTARTDGRGLDGATPTSGRSNPDVAADYLDKIVQVTYRLRTPSPPQRFFAIADLASAAARAELRARRASVHAREEEPADGDFFDANVKALTKPLDTPPRNAVRETPVEDTADELEAYEDYQELLPENPRELKRLSNIHRLVKILLQDDDASWPRDEQRRLLLWLIICARWPVPVTNAVESLESLAADGFDDVDVLAWLRASGRLHADDERTLSRLGRSNLPRVRAAKRDADRRVVAERITWRDISRRDLASTAMRCGLLLESSSPQAARPGDRPPRHDEIGGDDGARLGNVAHAGDAPPVPASAQQLLRETR